MGTGDLMGKYEQIGFGSNLYTFINCKILIFFHLVKNYCGFTLFQAPF